MAGPLLSLGKFANPSSSACSHIWPKASRTRLILDWFKCKSRYSRSQAALRPVISVFSGILGLELGLSQPGPQLCSIEVVA